MAESGFSIGPNLKPRPENPSKLFPASIGVSDKKRLAKYALQTFLRSAHVFGVIAGGDPRLRDQCLKGEDHVAELFGGSNIRDILSLLFGFNN
jgi:hypothetical protein